MPGGQKRWKKGQECFLGPLKGEGPVINSGSQGDWCSWTWGPICPNDIREEPSRWRNATQAQGLLRTAGTNALIIHWQFQGEALPFWLLSPAGYPGSTGVWPEVFLWNGRHESQGTMWVNLYRPPLSGKSTCYSSRKTGLLLLKRTMRPANATPAFAIVIRSFLWVRLTLISWEFPLTSEPDYREGRACPVPTVMLMCLMKLIRPDPEREKGLHQIPYFNFSQGLSSHTPHINPSTFLTQEC